MVAISEMCGDYSIWWEISLTLDSIKVVNNVIDFMVSTRTRLVINMVFDMDSDDLIHQTNLLTFPSTRTILSVGASAMTVLPRITRTVPDMLELLLLE